ncbi:hypothetical protein BURKHO8Y_140383 [Burkholderia sp. 8Y]|nr:hypothetical protein BURKHO8Y_140383 [Burkholderia sp. 8Y]
MPRSRRRCAWCAAQQRASRVAFSWTSSPFFGVFYVRLAALAAASLPHLIVPQSGPMSGRAARAVLTAYTPREPRRA